MKRAYKDFRGGETPPDLVATGDVSAAIRFDQVIVGCVGVPNLRPDRDPDLPVPTVPGLYTHPVLPGVLLRKVTSVVELFRLGSSFVIGKSPTYAGPTLPATLWGLFGGRAENVLRGNLAACPHFGHTIAYGGPFRGTTTGDVAGTPFSHLTELSGGAPASNGVTVAGGDIAPGKTLGAAFAGITDAKVRDPAGIVASAYLVPNSMFELTRDGSADDVGMYAIMAVVGDYEDGCISFAHNQSVSNTTEANRTINGFLANPLQFGTVRSVAEAYKATYLAGVPSDVREFAEAAYEYELAAVASDEALSVSVGFTLTGFGSPTKTRRSFGYLCPDSYPVAPQYIAITSGNDGRCATGRYAVIEPTDIDDVDLSAMRSAMMLGDAKFIGNNIVRATRFEANYAGDTNGAMSLSELIASRAATYSAVFSEAAIAARADAAGVTHDQGLPTQQRVPTLDTTFLVERTVMGYIGHDEHTYGCVRRMREFYRRVAKRAEDLVRDSA